MLVAEKKHHIETHIYGQGADYIINILKNKLPDLVVTDDDEELITISSSDWYNEMAEQMTPGTSLRVRRENMGLTQTELSEKTGIAVPNISLMEAGKRVIGLRTARKLANALNCSIDNFLME